MLAFGCAIAAGFSVVCGVDGLEQQQQVFDGRGLLAVTGQPAGPHVLLLQRVSASLDLPTRRRRPFLHYCTVTTSSSSSFSSSFSFIILKGIKDARKSNS